ncbi:MAG: hypothetical protein AABW47_00620 [Nanoarchaeota archaeon]
MKRIYLILYVIVFISFASAQTYQYGMMNNDGTFYPANQYSVGMMGMMYGNYGVGLGVLSWVFSLVTIGLIIAAIYWLVKSANKKR